ncbi:hypothetical protein K469DRAFT_598295 [Zopfia rhizophila CBS 207.26]|uniref:Uncharacterized protein n=1 Tax=Zopfia rhizophila CBS 207.26 TaxID=1314779 RepID=A0A6A6DLH1_9PEZI|nr:hypothetical protein K469DRAFT_598295 [Zopfia rhizophila CBS 207.26]
MHGITNSVFIRTTLTTCDVFVLALGFLDPKAMISPEQLIESAAPWFLDAETVWWRRFAMNW